MGIQGKYVNKNMHSSFYSYKLSNMGIHRKSVSYYSHSSFFIVTNFEIWVYIENICLIIHIVPFLWLQILKYGYTRE